MELPRPLAPWGAQLSLFPQELVLALGPLVQRLDAALGPLRVATQAGTGEPDGVSGLSRRGSYERLLLSEWLLADEVPDEFLRRAAAAEHSFLETARKEPGGARTCVALFDAGPDQMGAPRLAHLAALVVLARRARSAGAAFSWGILQHPPGRLEPEVSAATLRHLLDARGAPPPAREDLEAWREELRRAGARDGAGTAECWIVGGPCRGLDARAGGLSHLEIRDPLLPGARELHAIVKGKGPVRTVVLPLPEERLCSRLFRDPFGAGAARAVQRSASLTPTSNLVFVSGNRLVARGPGASLVSYPVPNSPRAPQGRPRVHQLPREQPALAVGSLGRSLAVVTAAAEGSVIRLEVVGGRARTAERWQGEIPLECGTGAPGLSGPLGACVPLPGGMDLLVCVGDQLVLVRPHHHLPHQKRALWEAGRITAFAPVGGGFAYVQHWGEWRIFSVGTDGHKKHVTIPCSRPVSRAFFGAGGSRAHPDYGLVALEQTDSSWIVLNADGEIVMQPPSRTRVMGVVSAAGSAPLFVLLHDDQRTLSVLGREWNHRLPGTASAIDSVSVSPYDSHVAYSTVDGDLTVYSVAHRETVFRLAAQTAGESDSGSGPKREREGAL